MKEDKTERLFPAVILNLSGIYKEEKFWLQGNGNSERCEQISEISWVDAQDISGTNCYCDEEAAADNDGPAGFSRLSMVHKGLLSWGRGLAEVRKCLPGPNICSR